MEAARSLRPGAGCSCRPPLQHPQLPPDPQCNLRQRKQYQAILKFRLFVPPLHSYASENDKCFLPLATAAL